MKVKEEQDCYDKRVWDCGSPLYDSHELASLGHLIERRTMFVSFLCRSSASDATPSIVGMNQGRPSVKISDDNDHRIGGLNANRISKTSTTTIITENSKKKKKKRLSGFHGFFSALLGYIRKSGKVPGFRTK